MHTFGQTDGVCARRVDEGTRKRWFQDPVPQQTMRYPENSVLRNESRDSARIVGHVTNPGGSVRFDPINGMSTSRAKLAVSVGRLQSGNLHLISGSNRSRS
jgi:hypothetical protein